MWQIPIQSYHAFRSLPSYDVIIMTCLNATFRIVRLACGTPGQPIHYFTLQSHAQHTCHTTTVVKCGTYLFVRSFFLSFVHSFIRSFLHSFMHSIPSCLVNESINQLIAIKQCMSESLKQAINQCPDLLTLLEWPMCILFAARRARWAHKQGWSACCCKATSDAPSPRACTELPCPWPTPCHMTA